jgi:hypothetical protein
VLVVVDDMPEPSAASSPDLAVFKSGWQCPVLLSESAYLDALASCGLQIRACHDLSHECRPRSFARLAQLTWLNRWTQRLARSRALAQVMESHMGGLALERLIRRGQVQYRMLVACKPILQVS